MVRIGNVSVASVTMARKGSRRTWRMWANTSANATSRSVHHRKKAEIATPTTPVSPRLGRLGVVGPDKCDEVGELFDEGVQLIGIGWVGTQLGANALAEFFGPRHGRCA